MAGDWRDIPGNKHVFKRLTGVIASDRAIAFVGARSALQPAFTSACATWQDESVIDSWSEHVLRFCAQERKPQ